MVVVASVEVSVDGLVVVSVVVVVLVVVVEITVVAVVTTVVVGTVVVTSVTNAAYTGRLVPCAALSVFTTAGVAKQKTTAVARTAAATLIVVFKFLFILIYNANLFLFSDRILNTDPTPAHPLRWEGSSLILIAPSL